MYAMTATRHDIAYPIGVLSQFNHNLSNERMVAHKHMIRYLNRLKDCRLHLGGALGRTLGDIALGGEGERVLECYVDSDYAGCPDNY